MDTSKDGADGLAGRANGRRNDSMTARKGGVATPEGRAFVERRIPSKRGEATGRRRALGAL